MSAAPVKSTNRFFDSAASPEDQILFSGCDRPVMVGNDSYVWDPSFLEDRLEIYRQTMAQPYVTGKDLVLAGLTPGEQFSDIMGYAHKLRLAGIPKETALKQVIAYAKKLS